MSNPESTDIESGIHSVESGIQDSRGLPYMGRVFAESVSDFAPQRVISLVLSFINEVTEWLLSLE